LQTIEINTAQNVKIDYELAGIRHRIFAFLIDFLLMCALLIIAVALLESVFININQLFVDFTAFIILSFYSLFNEILFKGQSLGKKAMGLKIIKINGSELEFYDLFCRWSTRLIDIYLSLGGIACFLISSNKNGQRIGDIIAGTCVIKTQNAYQFSLNDIERLNQRFIETDKLKYPHVKRLSEKDVLLIKKLLYRLKIYNNKAHQNALDKMIQKVASLLEVAEIPADKEKFLNQVISEYIIQTR
jgi:uncharacterized RDD family membrane protein YckC